MLDFVAIFLILLQMVDKIFDQPLITARGFLGVSPLSGDCKERVTLCSGFSGEKRPEWVLRVKS